MARPPRIRSNTGIEHIMLRGVNKQDIFRENVDRIKFLRCIMKALEKSEAVLHVYCLMDNHVHLLIQKGNESLGETVKRFTVSYVGYFNRKYERVGHLFQGRYKSVPVENETGYLKVVRYILQNPVKAGICSRAGEYRWSNYRSLGTNDGFTDSRLVRKISEMKYVFEYVDTVVCDKEVEEIEDIEDEPVLERDVMEIMKEVCGIQSAEMFLQLDGTTMLKYIKKMNKRGCKYNQIAGALGISMYQLERIRGLR